jgi:hypothetical protein
MLRVEVTVIFLRRGAIVCEVINALQHGGPGQPGRLVNSALPMLLSKLST